MILSCLVFFFRRSIAAPKPYNISGGIRGGCDKLVGGGVGHGPWCLVYGKPLGSCDISIPFTLQEKWWVDIFVGILYICFFQNNINIYYIYFTFYIYCMYYTYIYFIYLIYIRYKIYSVLYI